MAPLATGLAVALGEIAIGLGTIVGVAPVAFAFAGLGVNLVLFFTATWHVHPYFLGSDSIYAVAWLAYAIGSVEIGRANARAAKARRRPRAGRSDVPVGLLERREVLRGLLVGGLSVFAAMVAFAVRSSPKRPVALTSQDSPSADPAASDDPSPSRAAARSRRSGHVIARLRRVPVGGALAFSDPRSGDPSILLRPKR
ncbi:MAG: hypothetical protein E6G68_06435, partial [Actinobacteria bacterium]